MSNLDIIKKGKELIYKQSEALKELSSCIDDNFVQAVMQICHCKGKIIISGIGKSGHIANKICSTFCSIGIPAIFLHPAEASHGDLGVITANDLIIILSNSGESKELYDLIDYGNHHSIITIAIVGNKNSTLYQKSTIKLTIPMLGEGTNLKAPMISTTMMISYGDALAAAIIEHKNVTNKEFKKFHPGGKIGATLLTVKDIMRKGNNIPIAYIDWKMSQALIEISDKSIGCTAVLSKDQKFVGVITDGDLRRHMSANLLSRLVKDIMTANPKTISEDMLVVDVIKIMNQKKITSLFITHDNNLAGVIHLHDCLRLGLKSDSEE
jgi:arabinose-5-phosphate isomerase